MKRFIRFALIAAIALFSVNTIKAAVSERILTFTLTGFYQEADSFGNELAIPFRLTTWDILEEISIYSGHNVRGGVLVVVDSINDTNATTQIVARRSFNDLNSEINVTDLFQIEQGADVRTARYNGNVLKNATFYALDQIQFSTLETEGLELIFQGFSKESQKVITQKIGSGRFVVTSANLTSDGNGELASGNGLIGPLKGRIKIGPPKFFL